MNILITGVAGFIGSNLAQACLDKGCRVIDGDNMSQDDRLNLAPY
jgi:nucleoside-diphosphate-sugar epimerase